MSAKPIEIKKVEAVKSPAQKQEELVAQKVLSDSLNSAKSKRDVQIRTVDELETRIKTLQKDVDALVSDYTIKLRINDNLGASIQAAHSDLANLKSKYVEQNAKLVASYEKQAKEVKDADSMLQNLLKENRQKEQLLNREKAAFDSERESVRQQVRAMQQALDQNNAQWKVREQDILAREASLKLEKDEFEAYKEGLQPEIARITSIKNENTLLIQRLEQETRNAENMRLAAASERAQAEEAKAQMQSKSNDERMRIINEEARLRKWEQDLKDSALELRAKQVESDKILYREKLKDDIAKNEIKETK